jgi:hypothetical protein
MRLALVCALATLACAAAPSHPPPPPRRTLVIALEPGWPSGHAAIARAALAGRWLPGYVVRVVPPGTPAAVTLAHRAFNSCVFAGLWDRDARTIYWDPVCTPGTDVATHVLRHECLHALGAHHVCARPEDARAADCRHGVGLALLNPYFDLPDRHVPHGKACCAPGAFALEPTALDLAALRRVGAL